MVAHAHYPNTWVVEAGVLSYKVTWMNLVCLACTRPWVWFPAVQIKENHHSCSAGVAAMLRTGTPELKERKKQGHLQMLKLFTDDPRREQYLVQQLKALVSKPDDLSSVLRTHMVEGPTRREPTL